MVINKNEQRKQKEEIKRNNKKSYRRAMDDWNVDNLVPKIAIFKVM